MSYVSSSNKPSNATTSVPPISGVQRLNSDLAHVFDRIETANRRVANLADQFGTPENPSTTTPEGPVSTTNDHMCNIDRALSRLEQTIARIDNQT